MTTPNTSGEYKKISRKNFKVISSEVFSKGTSRMKMTLTLWPTSMSFSKAAVKALNGCERIRLEINTDGKQILIMPVTAKDKESVRWTKNVKEPVPRKLECAEFARDLFASWGWKEEKTYRTEGAMVTADDKVMMLFDFNEPESWVTNEKRK